MLPPTDDWYGEPAYTLTRFLPAADYDATIAATREALGSEGFGVLTEIDVKATLEKKLDVDFRPYIILGACNPPLAHKALSAEPGIGALLPCNVVVTSGDDGTTVSAINPEHMLKVVPRDDLGEFAAEVKSMLERVLEKISV